MNEKMEVKQEVAFVCTSSLHLATLLGTIGCEPHHITRGPDKTPQGSPIVKWFYVSTSLSDEAIFLWQDSKTKSFKDYDTMTRDERRMCINMIEAFAGNMRHYLKHAKEVS